MIGSWQQYGDIRTLYTACKHRGFVMVSYYDIRASRAAMRALQTKMLKGRKLDIHFSIPKVLNILSLSFITLLFTLCVLIYGSFFFFHFDRIIHQRKMLIKELLWYSTWLHQYQTKTSKTYLDLMERSRR